MMLLPGASPAAFLATHLEVRQGRYDAAEPGAPPSGRWVDRDQLLADGAAAMVAAHARLADAGTPPRVAVRYLAGWLGGSLAEAVGYVLAMTGAGVVADRSVRWRLLPGGWPDRTELGGCRVVVPPGHAWAGSEGVEVVSDEDEVAARVVAGLVDTLDPLVGAWRLLAPVGSVNLWAEVADGLGAATAATVGVPRPAATVDALERVLAVPGAPWRRAPRLWCAPSGDGPVVVAQKGGCCLAYTVPVPQDEPVWEPADDDESPAAAYARRFPMSAAEPRYCSSCRFRDAADVEDRLVCWAELVAPHPASSSDPEADPATTVSMPATS